jgi:heme-degrading monooxygenase HmoA
LTKTKRTVYPSGVGAEAGATTRTLHTRTAYQTREREIKSTWSSCVNTERGFKSSRERDTHRHTTHRHKAPDKHTGTPTHRHIQTQRHCNTEFESCKVPEKETTGDETPCGGFEDINTTHHCACRIPNRTGDTRVHRAVASIDVSSYLTCSVLCADVCAPLSSGD